MKQIRWMIIFFIFSSFSVYAANPVSKQYVDEIVSTLQTQINEVNTGNNFQIGQYYQGGVIFYLDNTQHKGLLVAINDANYMLSTNCTSTGSPTDTGPYGGCLWWNGTGGSQTTGATGVLYFTGQQNTETILAINSTSTVYPAAYVAHQYSTSQDPPGAYWYLPSQDELNELMLAVNNSPQINATIIAQNGQTLPFVQTGEWSYWSSTEPLVNTFVAWNINFDYGTILTSNKDGFNLGVRPVRTFNY